jgi:putative ABC transport system ATP-binding protein
LRIRHSSPARVSRLSDAVSTGRFQNQQQTEHDARPEQSGAMRREQTTITEFAETVSNQHITTRRTSMISFLSRKQSSKTNRVVTAPSPHLIIEARGVVKTYNTGTEKVAALKGIDFGVARGEMVAVMGQSGSGKTTLLNSLSGLDNIDSGHIWLEGEDLASMSDRKRTTYRAKRMGFIFQVYNLLPVLNAIENVELPLLVSGVSPKIARQRALAALERVELSNRANHRPAELSGGQRQRVTIARALVNDPAIVWADEPTGALDSKTATEIMALMGRLNQEQGLTFVLVTHDHGIGAESDRVVVMRDGEIVDQTINRPISYVAVTAAD